MRHLTAVTYGAFFIAGAATTMLSPLLPGLQSRWKLDDASAGLLFAAQFVASFCTAAVAGWLANRTSYFALLAPGLLLISMGAGGLPAAGWPAGLLLTACYGLGLGLVIPAGNLGIAALHPGASAGPLALLNLCWCAAAVLAPLLVALEPDCFLGAISILSSLLACAAFLASRNAPRMIRQGGTRSGGAITIIVASILFLYVGTENAISGWMPTHATRAHGESPILSASPSIFWTTMLAGRGLTPMLVRRVDVHHLLCTALLLTLAGAVFVVWGSGPGWLLAGSALTGLGLAPVFPLAVSQYADTHGGGTTSGLIFSLSGLGGATLPFLVGYLSQYFQDIRLGMSLVFLAILFMLFLQFLLHKTAFQRSR